MLFDEVEGSWDPSCPCSCPGPGPDPDPDPDPGSGERPFQNTRLPFTSGADTFGGELQGGPKGNLSGPPFMLSLAISQRILMPRARAESLAVRERLTSDIQAVLISILLS